jgi:2-keto-4-pentenoate hydratase/2-oxohepta-3-ene-1,7-dioic acid hydratase in catechol pathway
MRIVVFEEYQVGIEQAGMVREISSLIPIPWRGTPWAMNWVVEHWQEITAALARPSEGDELRPLAGLRLRPPVPVPRELLAAPENYAAHIEEMAAREASARAPNAGRSPREVGFFLKAPGSIVGPSDAIELPPWPGRRFDHEGELAFVIGRQARAVEPEEALDYIFGYTCLLDITLRTTPEHREERPMRKSFATFTPVGPVLVTADEIRDPGDLGIRVWVNGELRQDSTTADMLVGVPELLAMASRVLPLAPGDLFTTGSPSGVGPIVPGDVVTVEIDRIGRMSLPVRTRAW